jgi:hypothetical protein
MTTFEKLALRIKNDLNREIENVRRVHSGRNMKASGANSWISNEVGCTIEIGSQHTATDLLKAKKIYLTKGWSEGQYEVEIEKSSN